MIEALVIVFFFELINFDLHSYIPLKFSYFDSVKLLIPKLFMMHLLGKLQDVSLMGPLFSTSHLLLVSLT